MISSVHGTISGVYEDFLIVDVGGIGLKIQATKSTCKQAKMGDRIFLYTHLVVREDLLALYGFESMEERDLYSMMLGVSGIGPKTGMSIISTLNPDTIRRAILENQVDVFSRVPGIGKKSAARILLQLQGKIPADMLQQGVTVSGDVDNRVFEALTSLGYSVVEAQSALQSIPKDASCEVEERLKLALKYFSTPD
jgi:Holliday junction DNA helicase RuvA